jgi:hypothetical protein
MVEDGKNIVEQADSIIESLNNAVNSLKSSAPNVKNTSDIIYSRLNGPSANFSRKKANETNKERKNRDIMTTEDIRYSR